MKRNSLLLILLCSSILQTSLWAQSNGVFDQYSWLTDLVDPANCSDESIAVYNAGAYDFLLVTDAAGTQKLYLDNGTFYCQNSPNYDCVAAYNLSNLTNTWDCSNAGPTTPPPTRADDPIFTEYPWLSTVINTDDCGTASIVEYASGTYTFLMIDNGSGTAQLFFENGTLYCTSAPNYDCVGAYNLTEILRTWTCGSTSDTGGDNEEVDTTPIENGDMDNEEMEDIDTTTPTSSTVNDPIFTNFPWLSTVIGGNCTSESVTVYQQGIFQYLIIKDANGMESMYFQDGSFYCQSSSSLDCIIAYNLELAVYTWSCGNDTDQANCNNNTGTIVFQDCDNGQLFYFIRTADGQLLDIYFPFGNTFVIIEGQSVKFDYHVASFNSPCSAASQAVNITCITPNDEDPNAGNCNSHTGTFFFRDCDDGTSFFFIQSTDGKIYDPYFEGNANYTPVQGQKINFDFKLTNFNTPCSSVAEQAITITCLELDNTELPAGNCANNRGEMFFQTCADGNRYFLIRTEDGQILDPYYGPGISFSEYDGQRLQFDYVDAGFPTGCSSASKAITITCIEEIIPEGFSNDIPESYESYDIIYRICRGETLRLENTVRSIQCNCPANPQGPCDNFPFNQWGKWEGGPLVDNTDHALVSPTTTTVYENKINGYFCGVAGPTFGPTDKITYLVIVEVSQDCALPSAATETTFDVSGCVGDVVRVPAPSPGTCVLGPPIATNDVVEVLTIDARYLEVRLLQAGSFSYGIFEEQDVNGLSCPTANYVYTVSINNCLIASTPITKVFDYRVCIGEVVNILRPNPGNCSNDAIPNSNDVIEVIDASENFMEVKVLKVGSFTMSNSTETIGNEDCQLIIHDFSFVTHADCQESNFDSSSISNTTSLNKAIFNVYPNPSEGLLHIPVQGIKDQAQQIQLLDLNGRTIQETMVPASQSMSTSSMDLSNIVNGVYLIEISSNTQRSVQRVVKQ